jgi:hypothetical protein
MAELRATERQAAEDLGQWVTKSEPSHLNVNEMSERLTPRARAESGASRGGRKEEKARQALNAGTPAEA